MCGEDVQEIHVHVHNGIGAHMVLESPGGLFRETTPDRCGNGIRRIVGRTVGRN